MLTNTQRKNERIDLRISPEAKNLFARAAQLSSLSLSAFVVEATRVQSIRILEEHDRVILHNRARDVFLNALANPPAPNAALRKSMKKNS